MALIRNGRTITIDGPADQRTVHALRTELRDLGDGVDDVVVDLTEVTWFDGATVEALTHACTAITASGASLVLRARRDALELARHLGLGDLYRVQPLGRA